MRLDKQVVRTLSLQSSAQHADHRGKLEWNLLTRLTNPIETPSMTNASRSPSHAVSRSRLLEFEPELKTHVQHGYSSWLRRVTFPCAASILLHGQNRRGHCPDSGVQLALSSFRREPSPEINFAISSLPFENPPEPRSSFPNSTVLNSRDGFGVEDPRVCVLEPSNSLVNHFACKDLSSNANNLPET